MGKSAAQYELGTYYSSNNVKDMATAVKWYTRAANQGHVKATYNLACCYVTGSGVKKDEVTATKLFALAVNKNDGCAQYNLGVAYENGIGVAKDLKKAAELKALAKKNGYVG